RLFERSWKRFLTIWPLTSKVGPLELDAEDFAHWDVEAAGPNWRGAAPHEFLRPEDTIPRHNAEPVARPDPPPPAPAPALPRARSPGRSTTSSAVRSCASCGRRGRSAWC